jgi:hypothetical protein
MSWLPEGFETPQRVDLATGHHLRPIRESDVDIDYPAVTAAAEMLTAKYKDAWGWDPTTMTYEEDRKDLKRHEDEIAEHKSFNFAVLNEDESQLFGCVYVDPPEDGHEEEAVVSWWSSEPEIRAELDVFVPNWMADTWRFRSVKFWP